MYCELAQDNNLHPAEMALAFVQRQPFVTSTIIGATTMEQLKQNIASHNIILTDEILKGILQIHQIHPNPAP